jgi:general secretion pathway protein E
VVISGIRFHPDEIESTGTLSKVLFSKVINDDVKLGHHLYSSIAVLQVSANSKSVMLAVDRSKITPDAIDAVVKLLENQQYTFPTSGPQGYFLISSIVISLSQGHITANGLRVDRDIARDPSKNSLMSSFTDIVAWAYANKADDIDWALDKTSDKSQIAFKIGGSYVRPEMFNIATDTLSQMLGIAYQKSEGGSNSQFDTRTEQQAKVELDLPRSRAIPDGARVRLRWSGMANDKGTVVTTRIQRLGASAMIRSLEDAGYPPSHLKILKRVIRSEGGITTFSGVVGSGKSTSLAQLMGMLPHDIKCISIEDPVELEIPRMYQKTIARDLSSTGEDPAFVSAVRAIYRSALNVLLLGEIRDYSTGLLARSVGESGHSVYTTTHARSGLGIFDRFASPAIGIPRDVMASPGIMKLLVFQALLPVTCKFCGLTVKQHAQKQGLQGEALDAHHEYFDRIYRLYGVEPSSFMLRNHDGCPRCTKPDLPELNGLAGRTVVSEMIEPDSAMLDQVMTGNNVALFRHWRSTGTGDFLKGDLTGKTSMECAIWKASQGIIDPREIENRFMAYETVELQRKAEAAIAAAKSIATQN